MQRKIREADQYPLYKIKLGTDRDHQIIEGIRKVTDKPLRVDANEGWKTVDQAKKEIEYLEKHGIEIVEQPMHSSMAKELRELKKWSPVPLMADESFTGTEPLDEIAEQFDIINIKLMKIGSLVKAKRTIKQAQDLGLKVMIGCMIESSLAISAGGVLASFCEYADLDGNLIKSVDAKSQFLDQGFPSFNEATDRFNTMNYISASDRYERLLYDEYREVFYRFVFPKVEVQNEEEINQLRIFPRKFGVMILDKDLNVLGETLMPENTYFPSNSFVSKDGLYISISHPDNPKNEEDLMSFEVFKLKEID
jgi:hypothetical protein